MIAEVYGLSLIAIFVALLLAVVRANAIRTSVAIAAGGAGLFILGVIVGTVTHHADEGWSVAGIVQPPPQVAGAVSGEFVAAPVVVGAEKLPVKRGAGIGLEVFAPAAGATTNALSVKLQRGAKLQVGGWAADVVSGAPCKAVYLAVSGLKLSIPYGFNRSDVAAYFKNDALTASGFSGTISMGGVPAGTNSATVECLSADGKTIYASPIARNLTIE